MKPAADDSHWMAEALAESLKADAGVLPNPRVGALYLREGRVIGRGHHQKCGGPHAEVEAAKGAGSLAGCTLVVTLEPCAHQGRTPPCAGFILENKIARVVYGHADPGTGRGGAELLRKAGVAVTGPLPVPGLHETLQPYLKNSLHGRTYLTLKWAMTLDGKSATAGGDSRWITSEECRREMHVLRSRVDGILVGAGTALADRPDLGLRHGVAGPVPRPVVWDPRGRTAGMVEWWTAKAARRPLVLTSSTATWPACVKVLKTDSLAGLETLLHAEGLYHVLVEGGETLHGAMLDANLGDAVLACIAPRLLGGKAARGAIGGSGYPNMEMASVLKCVRTRTAGSDMIMEGLLKDYGGS